MMHLEKQLTGFYGEAPSSSLPSKASPSIATCRSAVGFPFWGASSQSSLLYSFPHKLNVFSPQGILRASSSRACIHEKLGQAVRGSFLDREGAPLEKEDDSVSETCKGNDGFTEVYMEAAADAPVLANDMYETAFAMSQRIHLRLDALDMQRDFRRRPFRPRLDVDTPKPKYPAKAGKRQNVPPKARQMILELRSLPSEDFGPTLKRFTPFRPDRADWLYVIRFFKEKEDKSMLLEVYNFVLLEPAFQAGVSDYTNLILVYVQLRKHEAVEQMLKAMAERGIFPDLVTYTVVIGMYGKLGNFDMVKIKFGELKLSGLVPDTLVYCAVIEAYSQLGHAREAERFLQDMELEGLPLKIEIFISLIRGYGNIGQVQDAERVFQLMQVKLFYPERRSYSALMDAYTKDEDLTHAIQVFNNMLSVEIEPTDKALARLLIACEKKSMLGEATEMMEKLEHKSFKFGTNALISFSGWLEKLGLHKEEKQVSFEVERRLRRKAYIAKKWSMGAYLPTSYCP
eukprot:c23154_g1_i1 orf=137-1675(+)